MKNTLKKKTKVFKKKTTVKKPYASKALKKIIQKEIHKDLEDKIAYKSLFNASYNSGIDSQADASTLIPFVNKGTGAADRIGEEIRLKSLNIKGFILANVGYNSVSNCRIGVRLMIVQPRAYKGYDAVYNSATTWMSSLLRRGNLTYNFTGEVYDYLSPINSDAIITYVDKRFIIENPIQYTAVGELTTYHSTKPFNINLKVHNKKIRYDASNNGGISPIDFTPVILLGYCHLDGSAPDTLTTQIKMNYITTMKYEDA